MAKEVKEVTEVETVIEDENELVEVELPLTRDLQDDKFVCVNGRTWQIQRGTPVQIPRYVKEVLDNSEKMDREALLRQKKLQNSSKF